VAEMRNLYDQGRAYERTLSNTRIRKLEAENKALRDQNKRLSAPVSDEEWRREFPCRVIHMDYPEGATCLDIRKFASLNIPPHTYMPEFRRRYLDYDRTLFCDNCWSCVRVALLAARAAEPKEEPNAK
jgi:hypothetical protein